LPGASSWSPPPSIATRVGSASVSTVSTRNSTGVVTGNRVNSTGVTASRRTSGLTCSTSQIAGTMNSASLSTNWKACT
jgi:hypothetical protein